MRMSEEVTEIFKALAKFQSEVESPKKSNENPAFKRGDKVLKYADYDAIDKAVTPFLSKNGISKLQFVSSNLEKETVTVTTLLTHESGEFIMSDELTLPAGNFGKMNSQTIGSAITYGRRYSLSAILGIASEDDDDGNAQSLPNKDDRSKKKEQPKEPTVNEVIIQYADKLKKQGIDLKEVYSEIAQAEGKENVKQVDNMKILGHLKAYLLSIENGNKEVKQESLLKDGTTTAKIWG